VKRATQPAKSQPVTPAEKRGWAEDSLLAELRGSIPVAIG